MRARAAVSLIVAVMVAGCAVHGPTRPQPMADDAMGADVANVWYAPGRAITCGTSAFIAGLVMTITLGHSYDDASRLMHGACSGPWTVGAQEIRNSVP
jgi:hypothetical protein